MKDLFKLPDNLPIPVDDGACDHLVGSRLPPLSLPATSGQTVDLGALRGTTVIYFYPMTGRPDSPPMIGWNEIPGARGCTPQNCGFRDHYTELMRIAAGVFGVSAQGLEEQKEAKQRLGLPFELLNDSNFLLTEALHLPTFEYDGVSLIKRLAIISVDGIIQKVFYPVFPPDRNAEDVIEWLKK
ncbi:MAG: peroxiredoxin [Betaproteobacteria bacterium]|nr:peroxiredoxin [Betaproteobacteria bacterium]